MLCQMSRFLKNTEEDKSTGNRRVEAADEDNGRHHEGVRDLLVGVVEHPERRRDHVLIAGVGVDDGADDAEGDYFCASASP